MPSINKETEREGLNRVKFIRVGDVIYYSDNPFAIHAEIADEYGVKESARKGDRDYPIVDDAGIMQTKGGLLYFREETSSCQIRGNSNEARQDTIRIAKGIFGDDKVADASGFSFKV